MNDSQQIPEPPGKLSGEELLTHLLAISRQMAGMRSVAPLLSYIVDEVMALVGGERGYVVLLEDDGSLDFKVRRRSDGTDIQSNVDAISHSVLDEVLRTKESVVVRNALMDPQFGGAVSVMAMQLRSIICSPLITQNRIIGAIYVENRSKSGRFVKEDLVPLEFFSNHAAVAIENAYLNENLETLVEERTRELVEAKNAAEAATRAKSTFLSTMTHELRTPMNGVVGMTSLLMDTPINEEQKEIIGTIRTSSDTLLTLINDILDFSKIEAQKVELELAPFSIENCIEQAMDLVTPAAADKQLHLAYVIDEDVPHQLVQDITRVRQVLTNLLSNAVKFTECGQIEVHVSLARSSNSMESGDLNSGSPNSGSPSSNSLNPSEPVVQFTVSDTGIGISSERLAYLFQPFSQAESSTTRRFGGTGLGLVICKRLCELMGGSIEVTSEAGVGTTFSFSIRAVPGTASEAKSVSFSELLSGTRLLLVTSSSLIERSVGQSLQGCDVALVSQNRLPTDVAEIDSFSAIIIDAMSSPSSATAPPPADLTMDHSDGWHNNGPLAAHRTTASEPWKPTLSLSEWPAHLAAVGINKPTILLTHWGEHLLQFRGQHSIATISVPIKSAQLRSELATITGSRIKKDSTVEGRSSFDATMAATHPLRILVAEDNIVNQKVTLRMLERFGYQADLVENGLDAVAALREKAYDVILMDIHMPKMDGIDATHQIRAEMTIDRQPYIVALTATATSGAREKYLEADMDEYISKPVSVRVLKKTLMVAALRKTDQHDSMEIRS